MFERVEPFRVTDDDGYITNKEIRAAYGRLADSSRLHGNDRAEAFLRLIERCAARGIQLYRK